MSATEFYDDFSPTSSSSQMSYEIDMAIGLGVLPSYDYHDVDPYMMDATLESLSRSHIHTTEPSSPDGQDHLAYSGSFASQSQVDAMARYHDYNAPQYRSPSPQYYRQSVSPLPANSDDASPASQHEPLSPSTVFTSPSSIPFLQNYWVPFETGQLTSPLQRAWSMSGSLDPSTGLFQSSTGDHPRLRSAHACDSCRVRKARCQPLKDASTDEGLSQEVKPCQRCKDKKLSCGFSPQKTRGANRRRSISSGTFYKAVHARRRGEVSVNANEASQDNCPEVGPLQVPTDIYLPLPVTAAPLIIPDIPDEHRENTLSRRHRPPPIDLGRATLPNLNHNLAFRFPKDHNDCATQGWRRSSLPPHLIESYSRAHQSRIDDGLNEPSIFGPVASRPISQGFYSEGSALDGSPDALSMYSLSHSNSSDSSIPITPYSLPESFLAGKEILYPSSGSPRRGSDQPLDPRLNAECIGERSSTYAGTNALETDSVASMMHEHI